MPFSPDYSDFLRMKKIQKTFEIDRQVDSTKFRATQPYGGYTPTYRIGYLPPNLFLPGRLYPPTVPSGPVAGIIDFNYNTSVSSINVSPSSSDISLYFHRLPVGGYLNNIKFFVTNGFVFGTTDVTITGYNKDSDYTVSTKSSDGSLSITYITTPLEITESTLIRIAGISTPISNFSSIVVVPASFSQESVVLNSGGVDFLTTTNVVVSPTVSFNLTNSISMTITGGAVNIGDCRNIKIQKPGYDFSSSNVSITGGTGNSISYTLNPSKDTITIKNASNLPIFVDDKTAILLTIDAPINSFYSVILNSSP